MHTVLIIIGVIVGAFFFLIVYSRIKMKSIPLVADHKNIFSLTDKNFQQLWNGQGGLYSLDGVSEKLVKFYV